MLTKLLADATGRPPEITAEAGKFPVHTLPTISGGWSTPSVRQDTSLKEDGVWGDVGSTYLKLLAVVHVDHVLVSLMTQGDSCWDTGPWQLRMLEHFRQQQAWYPLHLTTTSGEVPLEGLTILHFAEQDTMVRSGTSCSP